MKKQIILSLAPGEAYDDTGIKKAIANHCGLSPAAITGFNISKRSIDARGQSVMIRLAAEVFINEPQQPRTTGSFHFRDVTRSNHRVIIIGAGPAGLFAALKLIEAGIKPVILERGKDVRARRRDLAALNKEGLLNPESNYCFGEGGAGTYSDGKLYTRSTKRGDTERILQLFVQFGADEKILYESHPHIGTNKLPGVITSMRESIIGHGGEIHFEKKVVDLIINGDGLTAVCTADGEKLNAAHVILATGHSARDVFELLHRNGVTIQAKSFALGVRLEHPQELIDSIQYPDTSCRQWLPPASYSLVKQVKSRGVFSFCMCPGGIIAPASTSAGEVVVNGWSPSKRNNPFANSGMVVQVEMEDALRETRHLGSHEDDPFAFMKFQQMVEQKSFAAGGGLFRAPAQRMADFAEGKSSSTLPACSYLPGIESVDLREVLPGFIYDSLAEAFRSFGKMMKKKGHSFFTNEAVVVATESRTSSPVRIPRDRDSLSHPLVKNLYPCGEGAGYAGGIMSAAMDGERVAGKIIQNVLKVD